MKIADGTWTVDARHLEGTTWVVRPVRGIGAVNNWALSLNPRRSTGFWRGLLGTYIRREFPKTQKQLDRALADCRIWCERMNALDAEGAEMRA